MSQESAPPELAWPRWRWQFAIWSSIIGFIVGLGAFVLPGTEELSVRGRVLASIGIVALILGSYLAIWGASALRILLLIVHHYPISRRYALKRDVELTQTRQQLLTISDALEQKAEELRQAVSLNTLLLQSLEIEAFEIESCTYYRERMHIRLRKTPRARLKLADRLVVVDRIFQVQGVFEVTQVRENDYFATAVSNLDAIWSGFVRQQGETLAPPDMIAISIQGPGK